MVTWTSEENSYPLGSLSGWCNATLNSAAPTCPTGRLTRCQRSTMPETQRRISQNTQHPLHMEQWRWTSKASMFTIDLSGVWRCSSVWPKTCLHDITDACFSIWLMELWLTFPCPFTYIINSGHQQQDDGSNVQDNDSSQNQHCGNWSRERDTHHYLISTHNVM